MFKELKENIELRRKHLLEINQAKTRIQEELEIQRKQKEEVYLNPILEKEKVNQQAFLEETNSFATILEKNLDDFVELSSEDKSKNAKKLLKECIYFKSLGLDTNKEVLTKITTIFDYFIKTKDIDMAISCLDCKTFPVYRQESIERKRKEYTEFLQDFAQEPKYTEGSKYILGYGSSFDQIIAIAKLSGELDYMSSHSKNDAITYSDRTKEYILDVASGKYGELYKYIYADGDFGHMEKAREVLMYWHDQEYTKIRNIESEMGQQ